MLELKNIYGISTDEIIQNIKLSLQFDSDKYEKLSVQKMMAGNSLLILNEESSLIQEKLN